jgi:hypothetical protein
MGNYKGKLFTEYESVTPGIIAASTALSNETSALHFNIP